MNIFQYLPVAGAGTEAGGAEDEESAIVKEFFKQKYMKTEERYEKY